MTEDTETVRKAVGGDTDAFEQLVLLHQKKVYNIALRITGNAEDAFDLSQEAFLRAFRSISGFKMESNFSTWLYSIISNLCMDFHRKKRRLKEVSLTYNNENSEEMEIADDRFAPELEYDKKELAEIIENGMKKLTPEHREVFAMRDISGLSYAEISEALGVEVGTIKSRLYRAREKLRGIVIANGNILINGASNSQNTRRGVGGNV